MVPCLLQDSFSRPPPSLRMTSAFASPVLLYSTLGPLSEKSGSVRCTAAPERARVSEVSLLKCHRVLSKNLPVSERPPPVPRHYSIPLLRIYPAIGTLTRRTVEDTEILGKFVSEGSRIFLDIAASQRSDENYRDAQEIIPERSKAET